MDQLFQGFVPDVVSEVCEVINKPVIPMFGFFASNVVASYQ